MESVETKLRSLIEARLQAPVQALPWTSVSRVVLNNEDCPDYPGLKGTGFFCRLNNDVDDFFFVTARHCMLGDLCNDVDPVRLCKTVRLPYAHEDAQVHEEEHIRFDQVVCPLHDDTEKPGKYEDLLIFRLSNEHLKPYRQMLMDRALELPVSGLTASDIEQLSIDKVHVLGCPLFDNEQSGIDYCADSSVDIFFQKYNFTASLKTAASYADRHSIENIDFDQRSINGFSGSPVLWQFQQNGKWRNVLIGMLLTGNKDRGELLNGALIISAIEKMKNA
ncbi:hypothetical protein PS3A_35010 [Pseudomonas sp. 3A(2025)]